MCACELMQPNHTRPMSLHGAASFLLLLLELEERPAVRPARPVCAQVQWCLQPAVRANAAVAGTSKPATSTVSTRQHPAGSCNAQHHGRATTLPAWSRAVMSALLTQRNRTASWFAACTAEWSGVCGQPLHTHRGGRQAPTSQNGRRTRHRGSQDAPLPRPPR